MWGAEDIVGPKFIIFLYHSGNASGAARRDLAYLEQCVYDLCSNGILIDTMGADDILCLPTDDASHNKQKQSNPMPCLSDKMPLSITSAIICIVPFSQVHPPTLLYFAH